MKLFFKRNDMDGIVKWRQLLDFVCRCCCVNILNAGDIYEIPYKTMAETTIFGLRSVTNSDRRYSGLSKTVCKCPTYKEKSIRTNSS